MSGRVGRTLLACSHQFQNLTRCQVQSHIVRHACQSGGGVQHSGWTRPVNVVHRRVGGVHFRAHCSTHNVWSRVKVVKRMRDRKLMLLRIPASNYGREQLH